VRQADVCGVVAFDDAHCMLEAGREITFGRAPGNDVRLGHAPLLDSLVPRYAGVVFECRGQLLVKNLDDQLAFDLRSEGRGPVPVTPGMVAGPPEREFDIVVHGTVRYTIAVTNLGRAAVRTYTPDDVVDEQPPTGARVELTDRQRQILNAYVTPVLHGGSPASHSQVASALNLSRALVRLECNRIWSKMLLAGVPMRDFTDARDQIVDAWLRHRF
jgi:hypothetical protein